MSDSETAPTTTEKKKKRSPRPKRYILCEVTTVEGTDDRALLPLDTDPLAIPPSKANTASEIQRYAKKAVYDRGLAEYGNKDLVVAALGEVFRFDFVESKKLVPPGQA